MKLINAGNKDVFLGGGSKLPPGETVIVRKQAGELLLRNPNIKEVENGKANSRKAAKRTK